MKISINVLCYGDYPELADRCLGSIVRSLGWGHVADLRVGLNAVSEATAAVAAAHLHAAGRMVPAYSYRTERNVGKYPLMRRMFNDAKRPLADYVTWFDDDSFVRDESPAFWQAVVGRMRDADMIGSTYWQGFKPSQRSRIPRQPWFAGRPLAQRAYFATGGWWTIRASILGRWDYPFEELYHKGGDVALGELFRQQGLRLLHFNDGVAINYDKDRGGESHAVTRGIQPDETPWAFSADPDPAVHDFVHKVRCYVTLPVGWPVRDEAAVPAELPR
jgi:hypothetical protein